MVTKPSLELQTRADSQFRIDEVQINDVTNEVRIKYVINGNFRSLRVDPPGFWARLLGHTMRDKIEKMKEEIQIELDKKKEEYIRYSIEYEAKQKAKEESHRNLKKIADEMNAKIKKPNVAIIDDKPVHVVAELGNTMFYRERNPYTNMQPVSGRHTHSALREKPRHSRPPAPAPQRPASRPTSYSGNSYRSNNGYDPNSPIYDYENDYNRNSGSSNIFGGGSIFGGSNNDNDSCRHNDGGYSGGGGSSIDCSPGGDD